MGKVICLQKWRDQHPPEPSTLTPDEQALIGLVCKLGWTRSVQLFADLRTVLLEGDVIR